MLNLEVILISRPLREPTLDNFAVRELPVSKIANGQVLVKNDFLSLDPYMRGRMNDSKSYAPPQGLNEVFEGRTVGTVISSKNPEYKEGDQVFCNGGWQRYFIADSSKQSALKKLETAKIPISAYLGAAGMPGITAWYGLVDILKARPGQTVTVSAASGAVGGVFGQLAKKRNLRVVGFAGGKEKCTYVTEELGFDDCIDYKLYSDSIAMADAVRASCPNGIDGHFENVGGKVLDSVLLNANPFSKIALCGMIAGYNSDPIPIKYPQLLLRNRMSLEGFIISEHTERWSIALKELTEMLEGGKLKYKESIAIGLESAPSALIGMLSGKNFGKQLVKIS